MTLQTRHDFVVHATPFFHRKALFNLQYQAYWTDDSEQDSNVTWIEAFRKEMNDARFTVGAYVNYCDEKVENYLTAYYGFDDGKSSDTKNVETLKTIKRKVDPNNFFSIPQGIL